MNNRAFRFSFIIAALAVLMIYSYVTSTVETLKGRYGDEISVVIAKKDIKELDVLDDTNLTTKPIPSTFKEPNVVSEIKDVNGGLAAAPIEKGEQITRSKVIRAGVQSGLARQISIGKRGVTLPISDASGVAKLLKPGDRVDVIVYADLAAGKKELAEVHTILQDVLVLATGKYVTNTVPGILEADPYRNGGQKNVIRLAEYNNYTNVTLEVDPAQAQTLIFAQQGYGTVFLSLRNNDDNSKDDINKTMQKDIIGGADSRGKTLPPSGGH